MSENQRFKTIESELAQYVQYLKQENRILRARISEYLAGLLANQQTGTYTHRIWSFDPPGEPENECLVKFKGIRQSRLLVWHTIACFRDVKGKWWFVTLDEHYHRNHPMGQKDLFSDTPANG